MRIIFAAPRTRCVALAITLLFSLPALSGCKRTARDDAADAKSAPVYVATVINPKLEKGMTEPVTGAMFVWGEDGAILRSEDGRVWQFTPTPIASLIKQVAANDDGKTMVAVSEAGQILRSEDNGRAWALLQAPIAADLRSVIYHAPSKSWLIVGTAGTVLRSEDGGKQWQPIHVDTPAELCLLYTSPSPRD